MLPHQQLQFPAVPAQLKNGVAATLRPLTTSDGAALAEFYASIKWGEYRHYCPYPLAALTAKKNAASADLDGCATIVLVGTDGRIGGYAWFRWDAAAAPRESVFGICVRGEYQNCGSGAALMKRIAEVAREVGPGVMSLTVQLANPRAVALYKKMGFAVVREQMRDENTAAGLEAEPEYYMERVTR